jgi:LPXTG-motif cell wall-anchored protein
MNEQFKIIDYVPVGEPMVTGTSGYTQWKSLSEKKLYAWKEVESPVDYTGSEDYHYFVGYQHIDVNSEQLPQPLLSDEEQLKRKHVAWALDDAAQFANGIRVASIANLTTWTATNIHTPFTTITATKVWQGDSDNLFDTRPKEGIKLQLVRIHPDGTRENYGDPVAVNVDDSGNWPSYIWNRLKLFDENNPKENETPYKYTVVEERVDGYTTTYSDSGNGQISGTITVTNKMIPKNTNIYVHKVFEGFTEGEPLPTQIGVSLLKIRTDKEGNVSEPVEVREAMLTASNNWSYAFEKLDTKEVVDGTGYTLTYTVREDTAELERQGFSYTVSYSDNNEGVLETTETDPLVITNRKRVGSVKVTKSFVGIETTEFPSQFKINAAWGEGENSRLIELTTSGDQPENVSRIGSGSSDDPFEWTISNIPIGTEVTFTESGYDVDGYEVSITGSATTEDKTTATAIADEVPGVANFVNTYTPLILDVTKIWKDNSGQNVEWVKDIELVLHKKAKTGTEEMFTYTVKAGSATSTDAGAPTASVSGNKDTGYTVHYTNLQPGYEYYVTETQVDGYRVPEYKDKDVHAKPAGKEYATDKEYIVNRPEDAYELPKTGGSGTGMITILGSILILLGAGVLFLRRRSESL